MAHWTIQPLFTRLDSDKPEPSSVVSVIIIEIVNHIVSRSATAGHALRPTACLESRRSSRADP